MKSIVFPFLFVLLMGSATAQTRVIAVEGSATIATKPDIIRIKYFFSDIDKENGRSAKKAVDARAAASIDALVKLGVEKEQITSPGISVGPVPAYDENDNYIESGQTQVARELELELRDTALYSRAIQALVDSGISRIDDVKPDVSNYDELRLQALAAAAESATKEANFLANRLGAQLGDVYQIGRQDLRKRFDFDEIVVTARKQTETGYIPYEFEPGDVEISAELYVEFVLE